MIKIRNIKKTPKMESPFIFKYMFNIHVVPKNICKLIKKGKNYFFHNTCTTTFLTRIGGRVFQIIITIMF